MTGPSEILWSGLGINRGEYCGRAIRSGDTSRDAFPRVDRDGKRGSQIGCVIGDLGSQVQFVATFFCEGQANQAARMPGHEINDFRRGFFGSADKVAFIFAIFIIDDDDHATVTNFGGGFFDGGKWHSQLVNRSGLGVLLLDYVNRRFAFCEIGRD